MKNNITKEEYFHRMLELVSTWELEKSCQPRNEKWPHWIDGCMPYAGTCAEHNQGYESRPYMVLDFQNISEYRVEVEGIVAGFVLAACKHYAEKLLKGGYQDFQI